MKRAQALWEYSSFEPLHNLTNLLFCFAGCGIDLDSLELGVCNPPY